MNFVIAKPAEAGTTALAVVAAPMPFIAPLLDNINTVFVTVGSGLGCVWLATQIYFKFRNELRKWKDDRK